MSNPKANSRGAAARSPQGQLPRPPDWKPSPDIRKTFGQSVAKLEDALWEKTARSHPDDVARKNFRYLRFRALSACMLPVPTARREMLHSAQTRLGKVRKSMETAAKQARALARFLGSDSLLIKRAARIHDSTDLIGTLRKLASQLELSRRMPASDWYLVIHYNPFALVGGRGRKSDLAKEVALYLEAIFRNYTTDDRYEWRRPLDAREMPIGGRPHLPLVAEFVSAAFKADYVAKDFENLARDRAKRKILPLS